MPETIEKEKTLSDMETPMSELLMAKIETAARRAYCYVVYFDVAKSTIKQMLEKFAPSRPADGSKGFIAYTNEKRRVKMKTARFLTRKLKLKEIGLLNDEVIERLAGEINLLLFGADWIKVKMLHGPEITEAYRDCIGAQSCMTGNCAAYTCLYEMNPERFAMLVMEAGDNHARAIVSTLDSGKRLLDRVFSDCELLKEEMRKYAIKQGWFYRFDDDPADCKVSCSTQNSDLTELIVSGLVWSDGAVPYMDTLKNALINEEDHTLTIFHYEVKNKPEIDDKTFRLETTDGSIRRLFCAVCGCSLHGREPVIEIYNSEDELICENCWDESYVTCDFCGTAVYKEDVICLTDTREDCCELCEEDYTQECECCGKVFSIKKAGEVSETGEGWVCIDCVESEEKGE